MRQEFQAHALLMSVITHVNVILDLQDPTSHKEVEPTVHLWPVLTLPPYSTAPTIYRFTHLADIARILAIALMT